MAYRIVVLSSTNRICHRMRPHATYSSALGYLERNLPNRPELDMIDDQGRFVAWELSPEPLATA